MKSKVMKRAHELAKQMTGDYVARLSLALRLAWKEVKNVKELIGSEKQVKWANDIRKESLRVLDEGYKLVQNAEEDIREKKEALEESYLRIRKTIEEIDQAKIFIDHLRNLLSQKDDMSWQLRVMKEDFVYVVMKKPLKCGRFLNYASKQAFYNRGKGK